MPLSTFSVRTLLPLTKSKPALDPNRIKRVVVRGVNWVGDTVMSVAALRELRRLLPGAHITLATRSSTAGIFADADFIDDILIYDRRDFQAPFRQAIQWRKRRFDVALLFQNAFEAAFIAAAAGVPHRIGYATDNRRLLLTHALARPAWHNKRHEVFYYTNIVAELERLLAGAAAVPAASVIESREPSVQLDVSPARQTSAREMLRRAGAHHIDEHRPIVALCPGSTNSRAKRWPANSFAQVADSLIDRANADVVLIGASSELDVSQQVAARMRYNPIVLTGQTSLAETVALLSITDVFITNDTGPAHIAAALDRPTLVIFGPTNPATTRPFSAQAEIVRRPPMCAPCMLRDCPIDHRCMTAITPEEIFARAAALINPHPAGNGAATG